MMITGQLIGALKPTAARIFRRWIIHLGGLGLIPLGLLDSSIIPIPGSMDVVTIILCAREQEWWLYYALMATAGSGAGKWIKLTRSSDDGGSAPSLSRLCCRRPCRWFRFCLPPGPCNIR